MKKVQNIISYLPFVVVLLLMASLPFPYGPFQRIVSYLIAIVYPLDYIINKRWEGWKWSSRKWIYVVFIAFFALVPISQLFDPIRTPLYSFTLEHYAPFLIIGLCGMFGMTDKIRLDYIAWAMLAVSCGIVLYLIGRVGFAIDGLYNWAVAFNTYRWGEVNSHMVVNLYFNLSLIMGAMILLESQYKWSVKAATGFLMVFPIFALSISEGRTGLLTFLVSSLILTIYYLFTRRRWWMMTIITFIIAGVGVMVGTSSQWKEKPVADNPRMSIWRVESQMIRERPITGYGICSAREELISRGLADEQFKDRYACEIEGDPQYRKNGVVTYEKMHPHNVLLESWAQFGIIGVLLFIACLILPFCMKLGESQLYLDLAVVAFSIQACFESLGTHLLPLCLCLPVLVFHYARESSASARQMPKGV